MASSIGSGSTGIGSYQNQPLSLSTQNGSDDPERLLLEGCGVVASAATVARQEISQSVDITSVAVLRDVVLDALFPIQP